VLTNYLDLKIDLCPLSSSEYFQVRHAIYIGGSEEFRRGNVYEEKNVLQYAYQDNAAFFLYFGETIQES